jgi:hypothetical protein
MVPMTTLEPRSEIIALLQHEQKAAKIYSFRENDMPGSGERFLKPTNEFQDQNESFQISSSKEGISAHVASLIVGDDRKMSGLS